MRDRSHPVGPTERLAVGPTEGLQDGDGLGHTDGPADGLIEGAIDGPRVRNIGGSDGGTQIGVLARSVQSGIGRGTL
jgi:hypothetical protein